jgi:hypothetical protein
MKTTVGMWIDHRKAIIVSIVNKKVEKKMINSNVEKQLGRHDGIRSTTSYESQLVPADDSQERDFMGHLDIYYDKIISCIRDAESILIFGPGEAKGELVKRINKNKINGRIIAVEPVDEMTEPQIVAKVRERFRKKSTIFPV